MNKIFLSHIEFFDIFSSKYDLIYKDLFKERTQKELKFISHFLPSGTIIDLACGTGRHAIELIKTKNYNIIGVDASWGMLKKAKIKAKKEGMKINFILGDMRAVPLISSIADGIICMFSAICHLLSDECRKAVVAEIYRLLIPGGIVILDVVDWHWLIGRYTHQLDEITNKLRNTIHTENSFSPPISTELHHYTEDELKELFKGFSEVELYSNFNLLPFREGDERIVLVGRK